MKSSYIKAGVFLFALLIAGSSFAQTNSAAPTNSIVAAVTSPAATAPLTAPQLPDAGLSIIRVFGALALVIGLFLGGVWLFRNWQRLTTKGGRAPRLNVIETRSLGSKQAIFVVGYEQERFLIASSPAGINLLSHLPQATEEEAKEAADKAPVQNFAQTLAHMLKRK